MLHSRLITAPRSASEGFAISSNRNGTQATVLSYTSPWWCTAPYIPSSAISRRTGSSDANPHSSSGTSVADCVYACPIDAQSTSSIPPNTVPSPWFMGVRSATDHSMPHAADNGPRLWTTGLWTTARATASTLIGVNRPVRAQRKHPVSGPTTGPYRGYPDPIAGRR